MKRDLVFLAGAFPLFIGFAFYRGLRAGSVGGDSLTSGLIYAGSAAALTTLGGGIWLLIQARRRAERRRRKPPLDLSAG